MELGQKVKKNGVLYEIYKIDKFGRCFAEDEYKISIVCIPNLQIIR
ncbi:MAG: hypothetical protein LIR50_05780 [Bacillota bacterium]|nr:hypothetical protein [Bacillota bacterium]